MIIVGAQGHAKEVYQILPEEQKERIAFFDNVSDDLPISRYGCPILRDMEAVKENPTHRGFVLGLGGCKNRSTTYHLFREAGLRAESIIASTALVGEHTDCGNALNVMAFASIHDSATIGTGVLVNAHASIHHDSTVGDFAEISPGARVLGRASVGAFTSIGANATVLPDVNVGTNVTIGAGAVVTHDLPDNITAVGVPASPLV